MASDDLKAFLRTCNPTISYEQYAENLHNASFQNVPELAYASVEQLETKARVPIGPANVIIGVAKQKAAATSAGGSIDDVVRPEEVEDDRSYAPSKTDWEGAKEAAARLGWKLTVRPDAQINSLRPQPATFKWHYQEDDSSSQAAVLEALTQQLQLPDFTTIVAVERRVVVNYEAVRSNKRTKLHGKTDYVTIVNLGLPYLNLSPASALQFVVNFWETKTTAALRLKLGLCRGAAATECLAANLSLQQQQLQLLPEGFLVVLTDMNQFICYMRRPEEDVIQEVCYQNAAVAYDKLSELLQRHAHHVLNRTPAVEPTAAAAATVVEAGAAGAAPTTTMTAELQGAEVADAARTFAAQLKLQPDSKDRVKVYVEDIGAALARALSRQHGSSSSNIDDGDPTNQEHFVQVPAEFAHLYL